MTDSTGWHFAFYVGTQLRLASPANKSYVDAEAVKRAACQHLGIGPHQTWCEGSLMVVVPKVWDEPAARLYIYSSESLHDLAGFAPAHHRKFLFQLEAKQAAEFGWEIQ